MSVHQDAMPRFRQTAGNVVELAAARRRLRPEPVTLSRAEVAAFSAAIRAMESRSAEYWAVWSCYCRACGEAGA
jgi:hypothetical protein